MVHRRCTGGRVALRPQWNFLVWNKEGIFKDGQERSVLSKPRDHENDSYTYALRGLWIELGIVTSPSDKIRCKQSTTGQPRQSDNIRF